MRFLLFFFLFSGTGIGLQAQHNLVYNGSFEEETPSPVIRQWNPSPLPGTLLVEGWITPTAGSADYFNSETSTLGGHPIAKARSGEGRAAFIAATQHDKKGRKYKEYVQGWLTEPLEEDVLYCVKFYVAPDQASRYATDSIGIYFSPHPFAQEHTGLLRVNPHVLDPGFVTGSTQWTEISGTYLAQGGERFLIIGSFSGKERTSLKKLGTSRKKRALLNPARKHAYYYLDDVSVSRATDSLCGTAVTKASGTDKRLVLMIDVSASMAQQGVLDSVKRYIAQYKQDLPASTEVAVITFSDRPQLLVPFTPVNAIHFSQIDSLKAAGSTRTALSLDFLHDFLRTPRPDTLLTSVVFFTDGNDEIPPAQAAKLKALHREGNVRFSAVQFGSKTNPDLQKLSRQTQGFYLISSKPEKPGLSLPVQAIAETEKTTYTQPQRGLILRQLFKRKW